MSKLPGTVARRRIYLMRHGHVNYFSKDILEGRSDSKSVPLTKLGREQADAAGVALSHIKFDRALSSGYPRTRTTAELVLAAQPAGQAPVLETEPRLVEVESGGTHNVSSRQEMIEAIAHQFENADQPGARMGPEGEYFAAAQARAIEAVEDLLRAPDWHTVLISAHEGINRLLLSWAACKNLSATGAFEQDTACINVLDFDLNRDAQCGSFIKRSLIKAVNITPYNYTKHGMNQTSLETIFEPYKE